MKHKCKVWVLPIYGNRSYPTGVPVISTVAKSKEYWQSDLSPFKLGPCDLYDDYTSWNVENAWQFSKVYKPYLDFSESKEGRILEAYWDWAIDGWNDRRAHRYPMGKGQKPEFSIWDYQRMGYIQARKHIYGPLYAEAVQKTDGWRKLRRLYRNNKELILLETVAAHIPSKVS